jgi:hypothetical protein
MDQTLPEPEDEKTGEGKGKSALLEEARARFKLADEAWAENRKLALEDMRFRAGDQWPEEIKNLRNPPGQPSAGRPCLVVDKMNQYVRQIVNDGRQNRPAVKVRPIDDDGDEEIAEALQGIIRHICDRSNADEAFDTALECAVVGGFGFFRVLTEYAHEKTFNQEIAVGRIRNPMAVLLDPNAQKADASDAEFGFVIDEIPKAKFKKQYPKAKFTDFESDRAKYSDGWELGENIRICEYFYKVEEMGAVHLLSDGTTASDEELQRFIAEMGPESAPQIIETRDLPITKVKWCRLSGAEILEENDWLGKYIPIIPVYGNEYDIDGKVIYSGLIRAAKDAQRLYNFMRSAYAERVALTPKAPWVAAEGQVEGHEDEWRDANTEPVSVLIYKETSVDGHPVAAPQRVSASDVPAGFAADMQLSEHDIQASMGMYAASLGQQSNEKSGKAIMARQREGDTATFHYQDNQSRAIRHLGRILVDLAPKVMDSRRVVRILGEDGQAEAAEIDPQQQEPVKKIAGKAIYNLNIGTYDVSVAAGPSYTTKRMEAAEGMMQLVQSAPEVMGFAGDLITRNMDWPGADDLAERFKLMLPPPIAQALQAKEQGQDPKIEAAIAPLKQGLDQAQQQIQAAEAGIAERDAEIKRLADELNAEKLGKEIEMEKLSIERIKAEGEANRVELAPVDNSAVEFAKIEAEKWTAELQENANSIVEAIKQQGAAQTATISAAQAGAEQAMNAEREAAEPIVEAPQVDTAAAIQAALQSFTEALNRPKTAVFPDGRRVTIQ